MARELTSLSIFHSLHAVLDTLPRSLNLMQCEVAFISPIPQMSKLPTRLSTGKARVKTLLRIIWVYSFGHILGFHT